jgi:hypothetical protein
VEDQSEDDGIDLPLWLRVHYPVNHPEEPKIEELLNYAWAHRGQHGVPVEGVPGPDLVLVEPCLPLSLLHAIRFPPTL